MTAMSTFFFFLIGGFSWVTSGNEFETPKLASTPAHALSFLPSVSPLPFVRQFSEIKTFCRFF